VPLQLVSALECGVARLLILGKVPCDLTIEQLLALHVQQGGLCAVTKMLMLIKHDDLLSISVDRVDNTKAYTISNVVLTCRWVNWARNKFSIQEFTEKVLVPLAQGSPSLLLGRQ
jgi:hypothetical protein